MFFEFSLWFTNCIERTGDDSAVSFADLLNSFAEFTGDTISIHLMKDYLKVYNVEFNESEAIGVSLYD